MIGGAHGLIFYGEIKDRIGKRRRLLKGMAVELFSMYRDRPAQSSVETLRCMQRAADGFAAACANSERDQESGSAKLRRHI